MIDITLLEYLVYFYHLKTLAAAADRAHISQPSLSRAMKKLEEDLGVTLFDRKANKIVLNELGIYTAELSESMLTELSHFSSLVQDHSKKISTYHIGSCAPGPVLFYLLPKVSAFYPEAQFSQDQLSESDLINGLNFANYDLIVLEHPIQSDTLECHKLISESLYAALPLSHPLSSHAEVSFSELNGSSFLMYTSLGVWRSLAYKKMPDSNIILIDELKNLNQISTSTEMCSFSTNLSQPFLTYDPAKYKEVPFSDDEAKIDFYVVYRKKDAQRWKFLHETL